jgi:hypothetical protein
MKFLERFSIKNTFLIGITFFIAVFSIRCSVNEEPVIEKASSISYLVNSIEVELGEGAVSSVPTVEGASPFTFSIAKITSTDDNHLLDPNAITINSSTGVITLASGNSLPTGNYLLDIAVANAGGTAIFTSVFTFIIFELPNGLVYDPSSITLLEGEEYTSSAPTINGNTPITFSLYNSSEIGSFVEVDATTGAVHVILGQSTVGTYNVHVEATNSYGSKIFSNSELFTINIEANTPDVAGKWQLSSATLVDGNGQTTDADNLVIQNFTTNGVDFFELTVPVGDVQTTTALVGGFFADQACADPASYASFFIELTNLNRLMFNCPDEAIAIDRGTWVFSQDNNGDFTIMVWSIILDGLAIPVPIIFENIILSADGMTFSGRVAGFPMVKDFSLPITEPGNLQTITTDMIFTKIP